jgi:putative peptidoglycan lipid II flippase
MGLNVVFSIAFSKLFASIGWMPHGGLALANSLATAIEMLGLVIILRRRLNGLDARNMIGSLWRSALAALGMGLAVFALLSGAQAVSAPLWLVGLGGAVVGVVVYFLFALFLRSPEIMLLRNRQLN